jgi:tRNA isopentenyl-2-thiomethyl-A-37 hydroxylase MiaE
MSGKQLLPPKKNLQCPTPQSWIEEAIKPENQPTINMVRRYIATLYFF